MTLIKQTIHFSISNKVRMSGYDEGLATAIKKALTLPNPGYEEADKRLRYRIRDERTRRKVLAGQGILENLRNFEEHQEYLCLPRGFLENAVSLCRARKLDYTTESLLPEKIDIKVESKIKLRDYQIPFVDDMLAGGSGIAVAPPGSGKTLCGLELIAKLGVKTLWITHTGPLANQTLERINEFLDVETGFIGGGKWKIGDVTVALVQTLFRRDLEEISKEFSLIIVDECHHVPARSFGDAIGAFWAHYLIGLSATPYRRDGLQSIMYQTLGPSLSEIRKDELIQAGQLIRSKVIQRKTGTRVSERIQNYQNIMAHVLACDKRVQQITGDVVAEYSLDNICAVLVPTIAYGRKIQNAIADLGIHAHFIFSSERAKVKVKGKWKYKTISSMPKKKRNEILEEFKSESPSIMIATYDMLSEGFDHKPLNRLFLAGPISHKNPALIEQSCGRAERSCENKDDAIIFDYVDGHPLLLYQAERRIGIYRDNEMLIESSLIYD